MKKQKVEKSTLIEKVIQLKTPKQITKKQMLEMIERIFGEKNIINLQELYVCAEDQAEAVVICKNKQLIQTA